MTKVVIYNQKNKLNENRYYLQNFIKIKIRDNKALQKISGRG